MRKSACIAVISTVLLLSLVSLVNATTENFTVPHQQEIARYLDLKQDSTVQGGISVTGGSGNDVNFYITDPNNAEIQRYDRATNPSFSFKADIDGRYTLHFDNTFSPTSDKLVTLQYDVEEPTEPMDTTTIIIVLVGICLLEFVAILWLLITRR